MTKVNKANALAIGEGIRKAALSYANKTGTAIDLVVVAAANAKHEFSLTPIKLRAAIIGNLSADEVAALPNPGSKWSDLEEGSNELADIFQWKDPSKPDSKAKDLSFYVAWSDNTPEGRHVLQELDYIKRVTTDGMDRSDIPADWMNKTGKNPQLVNKRKKYLEGRRGTIRKSYKDAVRLIWQLDMVNELEGCAAHVNDDHDDNTVTVVNKGSIKNGVAGEWKVMSVGAFLKLKVAKALEQGGSFTVLMATAERGKKEANKDKTGLPAINSIQTPETADKVAAMFAHYLDRAFSDRGSAEYTQLLKHLTATDAGKQSVHMLGHIRNRLNSLFKIDTVQSIYDIEQEKMNKAA